MQELASDEKCHLNYFLNACDDYIVFSEEFIITKAHSKLATWLGYSLENIISRSLFDFIYCDDINKIKNLLNEAINLRRFSQFECRYWHRTGDVITLGCKFIRTENYFNILALHNLTEERKHAQRADYSNQQMRNFGVLCAGAIHDLNNTLGSVILSAQLLNEENDQEKLKPYINIVARNTDRARTTVNRILGICKQKSSELRRFYIDDIVDETFELISLTFPKNIELRLIKRKSKLAVVGNANLIQQSMLNLCLNAKDAVSGRGLIEIELDTLSSISRIPKLNPNKNYCKISVKDNGVGIAPELHEKIFVPFFTTKKNLNGTGLGLANCQAIIHEHEGRIVFDSKINRGSVFSFFLPLCKGSELYKE